LLAFFVLVGCEDFLDTKIDTSMTRQDIETNRNTLWGFAAAFYSPMVSGFNIIDDNIFAAATDEAQQTAASGSVYYFNKGIISADANPLCYLYNEYYEGIRAVISFMQSAAEWENLLSLNRVMIRDEKNY